MKKNSSKQEIAANVDANSVIDEYPMDPPMTFRSYLTKRFCIVLSLRDGVIFNGILQATFQLFFFILSAIALKVGMDMREKQNNDLRDHGASDQEIMDLNIPRYFEGDQDLARLMDAKLLNEDHLRFIRAQVIIHPLFMFSCIVSVYGAIIESRLLILCHCFGIAVNLFLSTLLALFRAANGSFIVDFNDQGVTVRDRVDTTDSVQISWAGVILILFYVNLSAYGSLGVWLYQLELRNQAIRNGDPSKGLSDFKRGLKLLSPAEPIKNLLHKLKSNYQAARDHAALPTAV